MQASAKRITSFKGDVLRLMSGTAAAQLIGALSAPIISRIFTPESFGEAAMFASLTGIIAAVACLRYELAIVLAEDEREAASVFATSCISCFVVTIAIIPFFIGFADSLTKLIEKPQLKEYIYFAPFMIFIMGIYNSLNYWNTRSKEFSSLSVSKILGSLVNNSISITLGSFGRNSTGTLVGASIGAQSVTSALLTVQILKRHGGSIFGHLSIVSIWQAAVRFRRFPMYSSWSCLINTSSWMLPALILSAFFSSTIAGFYALGFRMLQMPLSLISGALSQVFFQRAKEANDAGRLALLTEAMFIRLITMGLFPCVLLAIIGNQLFEVAFGRQWSEAGVYTQILAPWALVWFVTSPLSTVYLILEQQHREPTAQLIIFLCRCFALLAGGMSGNPRFAIILLSFGGVIAYSYMLNVICQITKVSLAAALHKCSRPFATSLILVLPPVVAVALHFPGFTVLSISLICLALYFYLNRSEILLGKVPSL